MKAGKDGFLLSYSCPRHQSFGDSEGPRRSDATSALRTEMGTGEPARCRVPTWLGTQEDEQATRRRNPAAYGTRSRQRGRPRGGTAAPDGRVGRGSETYPPRGVRDAAAGNGPRQRP